MLFLAVQIRSFLRTKFLCTKNAEPMIIPVITAAMTISPMIILLVNGNKKTVAAKIALSATMTSIIIMGTDEPLVIAANTCIKIFILYYCLMTIGCKNQYRDNI
jgi:hypothetical protein